jgi:hypothetical protein
VEATDIETGTYSVDHLTGTYRGSGLDLTITAYAATPTGTPAPSSTSPTAWSPTSAPSHEQGRGWAARVPAAAPRISGDACES